MKNYKVRVSNESESKEVQELFSELGCKSENIDKYEYPQYLACYSDFTFSNYIIDAWLYGWKELTIPKLRDLVVLKRNDVGDATHTCNGHKYYLTGSEFYEYINEHWENVDEWVDGCSFEPIEKKEMKEFLNSKAGYVLQVLPTHAGDDPESGLIEVPKGADVAILEQGMNKPEFINTSKNKVFNAGAWFNLGDSFNFDDYIRKMIFTDVVWTRHTQPEGLPFVDDEPKSCTRSMRNTGGYPYQEPKDNVNHPNHYTQGGIECIDALESATIGKQGIEAVCTANIIKYLWRYEEKNGLEDVKKAQWYLNRLIKQLEK